jgi:hypothetical protein
MSFTITAPYEIDKQSILSERDAIDCPSALSRALPPVAACQNLSLGQI